MKKNCTKNTKKCFLSGNSPIKGSGTRYKILFLCVLFMQILSFSINAQTVKVSGTVSDSKGEVLPGVSVKVKGTQIGVQTDVNGKYTLSIPKPDKQTALEFTYIGFVTKSELLSNRTVVNTTLLESMSDLDEVVVIGYGTATKKDITGATSNITEKDIMRRNPVSIFDAIQGAAPGVQVSSDSGKPGEEGSIRIRGVSTLSDDGVAPLYIVDGVPMDNVNSINPNDIQSIDILKDAASAAIYGSRSANGVILITTKRGEEGKPTINVNYLQSFSSLSHKIDQSNRLQRQIFDRRTNLGLDPKNDDSTAFNRNADNDYQALILRTAVRNQLDVSMTGGTKQLKYFNSMQYLKDQGIIINSSNERIGVRTNVDYSPSTKLTLRSNINFSYQNQDNINEGKVIQQALQRPPQMTLYFPNGDFMYDNGGRKNPIAESLLRDDVTRKYKIVLFQSFDYQFIPKVLTFHTDISADLGFNRTNRFNSKLLDTNNPPVNSGSDNTELRTRLQGSSYLTFNKTYNKSHTVNGTIGINMEQNKAEEINLSGKYYVTEAVHTMNAVSQFTLSDLWSNQSNYSMIGMFARAGYNYKGKYILNATVRRDGSSRFGEDNRWGYFPSASAAWRFSDEGFLKDAKEILTDGKLRVSWGITGNQAIGNYDAIQQLVFGTYFYNGASGVRTNTALGNSALKWEETNQKNIGADLTFLKGRASLVVDAYMKDTKDLLYRAPLPLEIGYPGSVRTNAGAIQNKGIEIMVSGFPVRNKNLSWQTSFIYSKNKNKITDLPGGDYVSDIWYVGQGMEAGMFYGYKYLGIYQYDESNAYTSDYKTRLIPQFEMDTYGNVIVDKNKKPNLLGYTYPDGSPYTGQVYQLTTNGAVSKGGNVIWENLPDENGQLNGNIGNEDRQIIGNGQPKWTGSWINSFNYKEFSLSFSFYGSFGNNIYHENKRYLATFSGTNITPLPYMVMNLWKYPGQITDVYSGDRVTDDMRSNGSYFLQDGSFLRLQSVRFGYQLPSKYLKKLFVRGLGAYVYGNNLLTWTKYEGFDPEVNQGSVLQPGKDSGRYPRQRQIGFGVNINL